jgi:hypothetical protein
MGNIGNKRNKGKGIKSEKTGRLRSENPKELQTMKSPLQVMLLMRRWLIYHPPGPLAVCCCSSF